MKNKSKNNYVLSEKHPIPKVPPKGYVKINERSPHGQPIYYNKEDKTYITPDVDQHNGGYWKMATKHSWLFSKNKRKGTYDENLVLIGN